MKNDWILDVLSDLRNFARQNDFKALSEQLDDTVLVAAAELAVQSGRQGDQNFGEIGAAGDVNRLHSQGGNA